MQTIWLWPNIDAGADFISTEIRNYRENNNSDWLYLIKNFTPEVFQKVLKRASCAIGNSSSFIRDSTFSGVPVVLVGNRQIGREHGKNLIESEFKEKELEKNINFQLKHGKYSDADIYGNGTAAKKIVKHLINLNPDLQKIISYVDD
jgi:UDP-N-acetylglucosamine 2-epimerase